MDALVDYMNKTDRVRLVGKDTDISFSIKNYPAVKCYGRRNIPDGEVYAAPVPGTANGHITYNIPCDYQGFVARDVSFAFEDGVIVSSHGSEPDRIRRVLDTDAGSRRLGEFALGVNPKLTRPIYNTLFDEKMTGSLHLTPGNACSHNNFNISAGTGIWCFKLQHMAALVWFDDVLVRSGGIFAVNAPRNNPDQPSEKGATEKIYEKEIEIGYRNGIGLPNAHIPAYLTPVHGDYYDDCVRHRH